MKNQPEMTLKVTVEKLLSNFNDVAMNTPIVYFKQFESLRLHFGLPEKDFTKST